MPINRLHVLLESFVFCYEFICLCEKWICFVVRFNPIEECHFEKTNYKQTNVFLVSNIVLNIN